MNAVVSGATGLIGRLLVEQLDQVTVLTRAEQSNQNEDKTRSTVTWKPSHEPVPTEALEHREVIFHLAGEPVAAGRWSNEKKQRIRNSRVTGTRHLVDGIAACKHPPKILIAASAVGFYGDRGDETLDEHSEQGSGFLPEVCSDWEDEAMKAERYGVRVVCVRIGIVLADDGGALEQMVPIFRLGAGGKLGSGQQWMSWIHVDDVVDLLLWAARNPEIKGAVNAVAPHPVRNSEFTKLLAQALQRPAFMPVPEFGLRLLFGEKTSIIMASQQVYPKQAEGNGFEFKFPELKSALDNIFGDV